MLTSFLSRHMHSKDHRPVLRITDNVTVTFGVTLNQIVDVVEREQILKLSLWIRQKWVNSLLRWNVSDFGGITEINIDPGKLWLPDIYLYNNADEDHDGSLDKMKTKVKVDHNGTNQWLAPLMLKSSCKINVRYFPFDEQACNLKFGSWTYDAWRVDIKAENSSADLKTTQVNGEWELLGFPCKRNTKVYECCPQPYSDVTCTLKIRRRTTYFFVNLIVPCFLITLLSLLSFFLPSEAGERITLVITNMLALTVFMLIVADILPATSEVVPLISVYFTSILIEVGLSLIATCIVLKCYFTNPAFSEVPFWIRQLVIQGLGQLLKIEAKRERKKSQKKGKPVEEGRRSRRKSMADALDPNFDNYSQILSGQRNSLPNAKPKRPDSLAEQTGPNFSSQNQNYLGQKKGESNNKPKRPVSMAESLDPNLNLCHHSHSSRRNTAGNINLLEPNVPPCGACHELTVDMLHLGPGLPVKNLCRFPSRQSLRRESWCENPLSEKAEVNTNVQSQTFLIGALLHRQDHLVDYVKTLVEAVEEQDEHDSKREEWVLVAEILDTFFLYVFVVVMIGSTLLIFTAGTSW
ncbi:neuronal acetylcholine receptor subunit alpha-7-like isoform X1 [Porites lutea]|uniref:neuronal acetylcholine receptor subunit alpha-7-like isoform X1 n=1 Tax=Porites lutea TaxID=51062 RepID=UPI003CC51FE8